MAQFVGKRRGLGSLTSSKRIKISIYDAPPRDEISLEEFEQFALDRMRVLKAIDAAKAKGVKPEELREVVDKACKQYLPIRDKNDPELLEDLRKDKISHHVLRMAYSRNEELRRWFLRQEEILFKYRFSELDLDSRNQVMCLLYGDDGTNLQTITVEEFDQFQSDLNKLYGQLKMEEGGDMFQNLQRPWQHIYKVPFEQVFDLVSVRKVYLHDGYAYVSSKDVVSVIISKFRARLSRSLTENARAFYAKAEEEAERLGPLLQNLTNAYLGPSFASGNVSGRVTLEQLPLVMQRSAPLCMKSLHDRLRDSHHLKHDARMQFGLFLKGIGVTLEDSLAYWKNEFMKGGKTSEQFDKQYSYNIRHSYGMEGKRTSYTPFSCMKIINSTPVGDQGHGCPYKHWDANHLRGALQSLRLNSSTIAEVLDKAKNQHYQIACLQVYEALHPGGTVDSLNHPNQYFLDSVRYHEAKEQDQQQASNVKQEEATAASTAVQAS